MGPCVRYAGAAARRRYAASRARPRGALRRSHTGRDGRPTPFIRIIACPGPGGGGSVLTHIGCQAAGSRVGPSGYPGVTTMTDDQAALQTKLRDLDASVD